MEINRIDHGKYAVATLATAAAAGGLGATLGYNQSFIDKNGKAKDVFVSQVADTLQEHTIADMKKIDKILGDMPKFKSLDELSQALGPDATPKQLMAAIKENSKDVRAGLKSVLVNNFETFAIPRKDGQTVETAVNNYMRAKSTPAIWQKMVEELGTQNRMLAQSDHKAVAKEYIKLTYDTKAKAFKKSATEIPQTAIDFIKKELKQVKMNNALKWGGIASGFAAGTGAIIWAYNTLTANKK